MSDEQRKMSMRKQTKDALSRITALEESLPQIIEGVNRAFSELNAEVSALRETVEAVSEVMGPEQIKTAIQDLRARRAAEMAEAQKNAVAEAVKAGNLVKVEAIGERTLIIGTEFDKDGKVVGNGRVQLPLMGIKPEFREKLMGKAVGVTFDLPEGGKFEVKEIYEPAEKPAPAAPAENAAKVEEKPADAAPACDGGCENCPGCVEPMTTEKA